MSSTASVQGVKDGANPDVMRSSHIAAMPPPLRGFAAEMTIDPGKKAFLDMKKPTGALSASESVSRSKGSRPRKSSP